jgi:hypothetical protein
MVMFVAKICPKRNTDPNRLLDFLNEIPNGYQFNQLSKSQELISRLLTYKCQGEANWFAMNTHHLAPINPKESFMHVVLSCQTWNSITFHVVKGIQGFKCMKLECAKRRFSDFKAPSLEHLSIKFG